MPKNIVTNFLIKGGQSVEEKFIGHAKVFEDKDGLDILKPEYNNGPSASSITGDIYEEVKDEDDLTKMQYLDLNLWLPGDILLKADKMSMAHSLEVRVPFLDSDIADLSFKIPNRFLINRHNTKYALRIAAKEMIPDDWADRTKIGFPVPIRYWLREKKYYDRIREVFLSDYAEQFFDIDKLMNYLDKHYGNKGNYARRIWTVYVFLVWYKKFFIDM